MSRSDLFVFLSHFIRISDFSGVKVTHQSSQDEERNVIVLESGKDAEDLAMSLKKGMLMQLGWSDHFKQINISDTYALVNIRKFLDEDCNDLTTEQRGKYFERANSVATNGFVVGQALEFIFMDIFRALDFCEVMSKSKEHQELAREAKESL